jgi:hypothetical protein
MIRRIFFILTLLLCTSALAEYRVYQYVIKAKNPFSINQKAYMVTSTLDPQSYLSYHGGPSTLKIDLIRTWMCKGNTSLREYCESPYSKMKRELSSQPEQEVNITSEDV